MSNSAFKRELKKFWAIFDTLSSPMDKLNLLRQWADRIIRKRERADLAIHRYKFKTSSTMRLFFNENCKVCYKIPVIRHHIIQLQNGGLIGFPNVISICNDCHSEVHPWLK